MATIPHGQANKRRGGAQRRGGSSSSCSRRAAAWLAMHAALFAPGLRRLGLALVIAWLCARALCLGGPALVEPCIVRDGAIEHGAVEHGVVEHGVMEHQGSLAVYRLRGGAVEALSDGALAAAGDRVQVVYDAGPRAFGVVFSVDGDGRVTLHHPARVSASTRLERPSGPLPTSFELDGAPRHERFYFVTADAPLEPRRVLALAEQGRNPSFSLRK